MPEYAIILYKLTSFLRYTKDLRIFIIKVEKFDINNALLASTLGGLQDYNHGLDHPSKQIHISISYYY